MNSRAMAQQSNESFRIGPLDPGAADQWDAFVLSHERTSVYHLIAWRDLIERVFGHDTHYLCARNDSSDRLSGVLPLVHLRSRLFGDYMVSLPYFNYGGAVADRPEVERALMEAACALAADAGVSHIEFRETSSRAENWPVRRDKVAMHLALPSSEEELWAALGSKLRAQIKRPIREGAVVQAGGEELLDEFYGVFARNMRDLGTPVYARRFFAEMLRTFRNRAFILCVRVRDRAAAAAFLLASGPRLEIPWASSIRDFNSLGVNMTLYWESLRAAISRGHTTFDFGRSTVDSGTYRFKKQWGAKPVQLYWHYWLREGDQPPLLNPKNAKYGLAIRAWQKLPLFVANRLGPAIVRNLP